jgi:Glycogen recognition site of AMP-activated protein kinase
MNAAIKNYELRAFEPQTWCFRPLKTNINIRFVATPPIQLQIKHAMKTSVLIQNEPLIPSLFRIAAHFEDFVTVTAPKSAPAPHPTPFAELMLHPEKLEAALMTAKKENDAFAASRTFGHSTATRATRSSSSKNDGARQLSGQSRSELKRTEFYLEAPLAESVKLAADFTAWEKFPLDMIKTESGAWFTVVPLAPGRYSYRFIVDGRWCDDPHHNQCVPNPFGTVNAVVEVK